MDGNWHYLYFPGAWTAVFSLLRNASGLVFPHQTCAKFKKNNCSCVKCSNPGKLGSSAISFN